MPATTLYSARWVLPIAQPVIEHGAVLVCGDAIRWVGKRSELQSADNASLIWDNEVNLGEAVLMPGLVNAHSHLELTALRGFLEGFAFESWLQTLNRVRRDQLSRADLLISARVGVSEALKNGITTLADTTESALPLQAMRELGVRGIGYVEVFGPDPAVCDTAIANLERRVNELREVDTDLVKTGISPHAPYTVSAKLFTSAAAMSRASELPMAIHIAESMAEVLYVRDGSGPFAGALRVRDVPVAPQARSPVALLHDCGVLEASPLLIHAIQIDEADLELIARSTATVVHCPISNLKLGHGVAPLDRMLAWGVPTGLGTDSVASNDCMHLLDEARQAALLHSLRSGQPDSLDAHSALELATLGGARALGLGDSIGSLEPGKCADMVAFPLNAADCGPVYDPAVTLVHVLAGRARASLVTVAGSVLVRDGELCGSANTLARESAARLDDVAARLVEWRKQHFK